MKPATGVRGISGDEAALIRALERLREKGFQDVQTFSPIPSEPLLQRIAGPPSPIHCYTFAGGLLGFVAGLGFPIWSSLQWEIIGGGKPVVSLPPFFVIAFEMTMLLGGICTAAGLVIHARLMRPAPAATPPSVYDSRFSADRFGIFVPCESANAEEVKELLLASGLEEVSVAVA
jgi:hypothetical protein